uniref:PPM-type phosphatase domain-containing protein n=1 Tax=Haplochromis burtoni TaxID=8153 RepID=A0A3Q2VNG8_HAPBU
MLCRNGKANKLTTDHTPDCEDERHRSGSFSTRNEMCRDRCLDLPLLTCLFLQVQHANDSFLALTTDGINFLLSDQEICDSINQCQDPTEAADVIAQQALQYGSEDNATIIIIPFGAWGRHQSSTTVYSMSRNFISSGRWA